MATTQLDDFGKGVSTWTIQPVSCVPRFFHQICMPFHSVIKSLCIHYCTLFRHCGIKIMQEWLTKNQNSKSPLQNAIFKNIIGTGVCFKFKALPENIHHVQIWLAKIIRNWNS